VSKPALLVYNKMEEINHSVSLERIKCIKDESTRSGNILLQNEKSTWFEANLW